MDTQFLKMHGAGNDFAVFDTRGGMPGFSQARIAALADRRTGIGCDQFIVIENPPPGSAADAFMRIYNPDGGEAGACGNATRCVAEVLAEQTGQNRQVIQTVAGLLQAERLADGQVRVDMGEPRLDWRDIPLAMAADTLHLPLPGDPAAASMGNPHITFFTHDVETRPLESLGPVLEYDKLFPERANIGFAEILAANRIRLRVWERGAGLTRACGSGACAALVNAHRRGLAGRRAEIVVDGGTLHIEWRADNHVLMAGPAVLAYIGMVDLTDYPP